MIEIDDGSAVPSMHLAAERQQPLDALGRDPALLHACAGVRGKDDRLHGGLARTLDGEPVCWRGGSKCEPARGREFRQRQADGRVERRRIAWDLRYIGPAMLAPTSELFRWLNESVQRPQHGQPPSCPRRYRSVESGVR